MSDSVHIIHIRIEPYSIDERIKYPVNKSIIWNFETKDFDRFYAFAEQSLEETPELRAEIDRMEEESYADPVERLDELYYKSGKYAAVVGIPELFGVENSEETRPFIEVLLLRSNQFKRSAESLANFFVGVAENGSELLGEDLERIIGNDEKTYKAMVENNDEIIRRVFPSREDFIDFHSIPKKELVEISASPMCIEMMEGTLKSLELKWKLIGLLMDYANKEADRIYI